MFPPVDLSMNDVNYARFKDILAIPYVMFNQEGHIAWRAVTKYYDDDGYFDEHPEKFQGVNFPEQYVKTKQMKIEMSKLSDEFDFEVELIREWFQLKNL